MRKLILIICVGAAFGLTGCASEEPAAATSTEPSQKNKPEGDKASSSNQQLTINPDYKGN